LQTGNGQRTGNSTPLLNGPAIVSGIEVNKTGNPTTAAGWGLFKHTTTFSEALVAIGSPFPYTPLLTSTGVVGAGVNILDSTFGAFDMQGGNPVNIDNRLRILIPDPTFTLGFYIATQEPGGLSVLALLTVLTDIDSSIVTSLL
jgi:hypothetical protein